MTTWIKETDHAFYLMEGNFYLEKIVKESRPEGIGEPGEKFIALAMFQRWLTDSGFEKPGAMVIAVGIGASDPDPMPVDPSPIIEIIKKPTSVEVGDAFDFFIFFELSGKRYPIKGAYAHAKSFSVRKGDYVKQGQYIGVMGGTGGNYTYPPHVDFRLWINYGSKIVDLSPNVVEKQLRQQENR